MIVPSSTYRLQLQPSFGFVDAQRHFRHIRALGVSHLYLSPIFEAAPGSTHGYDVADPTCVRMELGGRSAFEAMARCARTLDLGIIIDIVPNHMVAHPRNPWWWNTLRDGRDSPDAEVFDIDWSSVNQRIVLPVLDDDLEGVLSRGELQIERGQRGTYRLRYFDSIFPFLTDVSATNRVTPELLAQQHYELVHWRSGPERRNYRRFFDINELVAVRVELESVFLRTHALSIELWNTGIIDGVRIDHIDGLARPGEYLRRLRDHLPPRLRHGTREQPYIIVEKILGQRETLPAQWPIHGTTGYETVNAITRLFVPHRSFDRMQQAAAAIGANDLDFPALMEEAKREIVQTLFAGELASLARAAGELLGDKSSDAAGSESNNVVTEALLELIVALDVYRTYRADGGVVEAADRQRLDDAAGVAVERGARQELVSRITQLLLDDGTRRSPGAQRFIERFEQLSGPAMAKGLEDTAHYRHAVLLALNEVGGEPIDPGDDAPAMFHRFMHQRAQRGDNSLTPLSTHDTKRSEDARARLLALANHADSWRELLCDAKSIVDRKRAVGSTLRPEIIVFLLQSAIAIWPSSGAFGEARVARLQRSIQKAAREAKRRSSWVDPDETYEQALDRACELLTDQRSDAAFGNRVALLVSEIRARADDISLAQTALRLTAPGVPDTYQGTEVICRSLVDPDNRDPVDYHAIELALDAGEDSGATVHHDEASARKLTMVRRLHEVRRAHAALFRQGTYLPLKVAGDSAAQDICAFQRLHNDDAAIVVVKLAAAHKTNEHDEIVLPALEGIWVDSLSGRAFATSKKSLHIDEPWQSFPALVLLRDHSLHA